MLFLLLLAIFKMATKIYQQGQQSLEEAQVLKGTAESQLASVQHQQAALHKQEKHLTQVSSPSAANPAPYSFAHFEGEAEFCKGEEGANSGDIQFSWQARCCSYMCYYKLIFKDQLPIATVDVVHDDVINDDIILPSFDDISQPTAQPTRPNMRTLLDQLDTNVQLRRIAMEAEQVRRSIAIDIYQFMYSNPQYYMALSFGMTTLQDDEYLEEEKNFLASLQNSGRLTLMELESSYS